MFKLEFKALGNQTNFNHRKENLINAPETQHTWSFNFPVAMYTLRMKNKECKFMSNSSNTMRYSLF